MKNWEEKICLQCGKSFFVRKCYTKRGQGKFCSTSCGITYRNIHNNYAKLPEVKAKISMNHVDVKGGNNPMFGKKGSLSPGYIDGRNEIKGDTYRKISLIYNSPICKICGEPMKYSDTHVHHKDKNRKNNALSNLENLCIRCHLVNAHVRKRDSLGRFVKEVI